MTKHTLNGRRRKVIKTSGFRARLATKTGRKILRNRRRKGRWKLTI
jgi:large subunit ribosomal protein L34